MQITQKIEEKKESIVKLESNFCFLFNFEILDIFKDDGSFAL